MLIKGGKVIDALASCKTIAFDKTGTLTTGALACTGMTRLGDGEGGSVSGNSSGVDSDLSGVRLQRHRQPCTARDAQCGLPTCRAARRPHHSREAPDALSGGGCPSVSTACLRRPRVLGSCTGSGWLERLQQRGDSDDAAALAAAVELSVRSNHPVSKAVAACGKAADGSLPEVDIIDFKLVPGQRGRWKQCCTDAATATIWHTVKCVCRLARPTCDQGHLETCLRPCTTAHGELELASNQTACWVPAGAGVQGVIQAASGGAQRYVRFGSAKFAAEVLPDAQRSALLQQVRQRDSAVSFQRLSPHEIAPTIPPQPHMLSCRDAVCNMHFHLQRLFMLCTTHLD